MAHKTIGAFPQGGIIDIGAFEIDYAAGGTLLHLLPTWTHKETDLVHNDLTLVHNETSIKHNR